MTKTVIYAVGGTGAKLLEAMIHLCAAGAMDGQIAIRMVDQDETNGNARRARSLLDDYGKVRTALRGSPGGLANDCPLFAADLSGGREVLRVLPDASATLANAYGLAANPGIAGSDGLLMQALFSAAERSGHMINGFRGQPGVGAAAFLSPQARRSSTLWKLVREDEDQARSGAISRFLFLGSIFGGTGAAGIPTLAGYLRQRLRGAGTHIRIGAVLMLRYFEVDRGREFGPAAPTQVRAALEFYMHGLRVGDGAPDARLIDSLYLLGLHKELAVRADAEGGGDAQTNPALLPELIGAMAGVAFHQDVGFERLGGAMVDAQPSQPIWLCGHEHAAEIGWSDLPLFDGAGSQGTDTRGLLCSFARFAICYAYGLHGAPALSEIAAVHDLPMYFRLLDPKRVAEGVYDADGKQMKEYCMRFLRWFGALHATANSPDWPNAGQIKVGLSSIDQLLQEDARQDDRFSLRLDPAKLNEATQEDQEILFNAFDSLRISRKPKSFGAVLDRLAAAKRPRQLGHPAFVAGAYGVAALAR